jgi:hypothetical protein
VVVSPLFLSRMSDGFPRRPLLGDLVNRGNGNLPVPLDAIDVSKRLTLFTSCRQA